MAPLVAIRGYSPLVPSGDRFKSPVKPAYLAAPAYFAGLALAFFAQSSQQTVISVPPTFTGIPPSLISQSHTGHFFVFMAYLPGFELTIRVTAMLQAMLMKTW